MEGPHEWQGPGDREHPPLGGGGGVVGDQGEPSDRWGRANRQGEGFGVQRAVPWSIPGSQWEYMVSLPNFTFRPYNLMRKCLVSFEHFIGYYGNTYFHCLCSNLYKFDSI